MNWTVNYVSLSLQVTKVKSVLVKLQTERYEHTAFSEHVVIG
jgi:hypothetical protein